MGDTKAQLNAKILKAHGDTNYCALAHLYVEAANQEGLNIDEAAFFLTQAYVLALSTGLAIASDIRQRLEKTGHEITNATGHH